MVIEEFVVRLRIPGPSTWVERYDPCGLPFTHRPGTDILLTRDLTRAERYRTPVEALHLYAEPPGWMLLRRVDDWRPLPGRWPLEIDVAPPLCQFCGAVLVGVRVTWRGMLFCGVECVRWRARRDGAEVGADG